MDVTKAKEEYLMEVKKLKKDVEGVRKASHAADELYIDAEKKYMKEQS